MKINYTAGKSTVDSLVESTYSKLNLLIDIKNPTSLKNILFLSDFLNNDNTWQIDLVVNYEVITDQSTLTYSEPVLTGRSKGEAPERRVKGSGVELGGAQHAYLAGGFYREDIEYFSLDTQLNSEILRVFQNQQ